MYGRYSTKRVEQCGVSLCLAHFRYLIDGASQHDRRIFFPRLSIYYANTAIKLSITY